MKNKEINKEYTIIIMLVAVILGTSFSYGLFRSIAGGTYREELLGEETCTCPDGYVGPSTDHYCYAIADRVGSEGMGAAACSDMGSSGNFVYYGEWCYSRRVGATCSEEKTDATCPVLRNYTGTYDGQAHTVTIVSGALGGTAQYSEDEATWRSTPPTRTNAGRTTVYVRVVGDENHNSVQCSTVGSTLGIIYISEKTPTLTLNPPTDISGSINTDISAQIKADVAGKFSATADGGATVTVSNETITANTETPIKVTSATAGTVNVTVTFTPSDTTNYKNATTSFAVQIGDYTGYTIAIDRNQKLYLAKDGDSADINIVVKDASGNGTREDVTFTQANNYLTITKNIANEGVNGYKLTNVSKSTGDVTETVTVCMKNAPTVCATYTVRIYCVKWTKVSGQATFSLNNYNQALGIEAAHIKNTCYYFPTSCTVNYNTDGTIKSYTCPEYYNRCCGSGTPSSDPTPACYANAATLETATRAEWLTAATTELSHKITGVSNADDCHPYACYVNGTTFENSTAAQWLPAANATYITKIEGKTATECHIGEPTVEEACYVYNSHYTWGAYANRTGYTLVTSVNSETDCHDSEEEEKEACYKDKSGKYVWGKHDGDSNYTLVTDKTTEDTCTDVIVPNTAANVQRLVIVFMMVFIAFGIGLLYWSNTNKKRA